MIFWKDHIQTHLLRIYKTNTLKWLIIHQEYYVWRWRACAILFRLVPLFAVLLIGCQGSSKSLGPDQDDLDRVAAILNQSTEQLDKTMASEPSEPIVELSETRIRFGDALELAECGLLPLIAERNSSLGRQKQESTRLIYEWKVQAGLKACHSLREFEWYQEAVQSKTQDVEASVIALLVQSEEAQRLQSKLSRPFEDLHQSSQAYALRSQPIYRILSDALTGASAPSSRAVTEFENALQYWSQTQHHGTLHQAITDTLAWLRIANRIQRRAIKINRICPMGTPTSEGRMIETFLKNYFGNHLQPKWSAVIRSLDGIERQWQKLPLTRISNDALVDGLLELPSGTRHQLRMLLSTHIKQWQTILQGCDLAPRAATTNSKHPSRVSSDTN